MIVADDELVNWEARHADVTIGGAACRVTAANFSRVFCTTGPSLGGRASDKDASADLVTQLVALCCRVSGIVTLRARDIHSFVHSASWWARL